MENDIKIMDGKAAITRCKNSNIWQMRMWISREKKYYRVTTGTRNKEQAIEFAQTETAKLIYRSESKKEKIFGITVNEGITEFLDWKSRQVATKQIVPQRLQTIISHLAHFEKYLDGQFKVNQIPKTILRNNIINGVEKNYVEYRAEKKASYTTIKNEMSTIGMLFKYWIEEKDYMEMKAILKPIINSTLIHGGTTANVRRQTFTETEYNKFTGAMRSYVAKGCKQEILKTTRNHVCNYSDYYKRELARRYLLFASNTGLRSGEIRQLKWENVKFSKVQEGGHNTEHRIMAEVEVLPQTSKVRKGRTFFVDAEQLIKWKKVCKHTNGFIFSIDGNYEYKRQNINEAFKHILKMSTIDKKRQDDLVPYSLRHYHITREVKRGNGFDALSVQCGTSIRHIESTYLHVDKQMMLETAMKKFNADKQRYKPIPLNEIIRQD